MTTIENSVPKRKPLKPHSCRACAHLHKARTAVTEANEKAISRFDLDYPPTFRQGAPVHEMEEYVTAEDVTYYVKRICELEEELERLRKYFPVN